MADPIKIKTRGAAVRSAAFRRARTKAEEYARDPTKAKQLLDAALRKAEGKRTGPLRDVWEYLTAQIRLIRAFARNEYREVAWEAVLLSIAGILYFVVPLDMIPDFIPFAGYLDDVTVISFVISSIKKELDYFLEWEARPK